MSYMGASDELRASLGPDFDFNATVETDRTDRVRWIEVCVCGHLVTAHAPGIGGQYRLKEPQETSHDGKPVRIVTVMDGCAGAMRPQTMEQTTRSLSTLEDGVSLLTSRVNSTCPCDEMRPVAAVDRPHRYFNQRQPADVTDYTRHPLFVGMRAYRKRIGKLKRAQLSTTAASWADEEFDRRFTWLPSRVCGISGCKITEDVWPVYVHLRARAGHQDYRSELRCAKHRE